MRSLGEVAAAALICLAGAAAVFVGVYFLMSAVQYAPGPVPSVFCPVGYHVAGISTSGQPDCAPDHWRTGQ